MLEKYWILDVLCRGSSIHSEISVFHQQMQMSKLHHTTSSKMIHSGCLFHVFHPRVYFFHLHEDAAAVKGQCSIGVAEPLVTLISVREYCIAVASHLELLLGLPLVPGLLAVRFGLPVLTRLGLPDLA